MIWWGLLSAEGVRLFSKKSGADTVLDTTVTMHVCVCRAVACTAPDCCVCCWGRGRQVSVCGAWSFWWHSCMTRVLLSLLLLLPSWMKHATWRLVEVLDLCEQCTDICSDVLKASHLDSQKLLCFTRQEKIWKWACSFGSFLATYWSM